MTTRYLLNVMIINLLAIETPDSATSLAYNTVSTFTFSMLKLTPWAFPDQIFIAFEKVGIPQVLSFFAWQVSTMTFLFAIKTNFVLTIWTFRTGGTVRISANDS